MPTLFDGERQRLAQVAAESIRRRGEALRLYRPMPSQMPFHLSRASEKVARGGNQSGKTVVVFTEFASAMTGIPLTGSDEKPIPFNYPSNRKLTGWVVGWDERHIGNVIYRKLFLPGAFDIIRDLKTGEWRAWKPWDAADLERADEVEPAPPLIPSRLIAPKGISFDNKGERVFTVVRLTNGNEIWAWSSGSEPGQGVAVDVIAIDEDIKNPRHVSEWLMRLSKVQGKLLWSAWPHNHNEALVNMSRRAEEQRDRKKPDVFEIVLQFSKNPYMGEDEKRKRLAALTPEEIRSRDRGEFLTDTILVFPQFDSDLHCLPSRRQPNRVYDQIEAQRGAIPRDWTHYLVVDPGTVICAALFATLPPPEVGDFVLIDDEIYLRQGDADQLARQIKGKMEGRVFETFIMDHRAGRQTPMGFGKRVIDHYAETFARWGVTSRTTGSTFLYGSDDIAGRNASVREWLRVRADGTTKLQLLRCNTPETQREFLLYKKRITRDDIKEDVADRDNHTMDCLGYLAAYDPKWRPRPDNQPVMGPVYAAHLDWDKRQRGRSPDYIHMGPVAGP